MTPFRDRKVKGQGHQAVTEYQPYLLSGKAYDMRGDLKRQRPMSPGALSG